MALNRNKIIEAVQAGEPEAVIRHFRVSSLVWPYVFVKSILGNPHMTESFHKVEMERFLQVMMDGNLLQWIEFPRGHFKTTCFTIGFGVWFVLPWNNSDLEYATEVLGVPHAEVIRRFKFHNQNLTQLIAFESSGNASIKISEIKYYFEKNILFRKCFPEIAYDGSESPWNNDSLKIRRTLDGGSAGEGTFDGAGADQSLQSRHYDAIWCDDLVGKRATEEPSTMEKTIRFFGLTQGMRGGRVWREDRAALTGVSNRWGINDLNSLVSQNPQFVFRTRSVIEFNETSGKDELIFLSKARWEAIKADSTLTKYDLACQYYNKPVLPGEESGMPSALHKWKMGECGSKQEDYIICSCGYKTTLAHLRKFLHYDPYAAREKTLRSKSCPALAVVGCAPNGHVFLIDYWMTRGSYDQIFDKIFEFNDAWAPHKITYEDVGAQNMTALVLRDRSRTAAFKIAGHRPIPIVQAVPTKSKPKEARIRDFLLPVITGGKMSCRQSHESFLSQAETFPHPARDHDYDLLDVLAQGALVWTYPVDDLMQKSIEMQDAMALRALETPYSS